MSAAGSEVRRIGILGAGRLGQALAARLADSFEVALHDTDAKRGEEVAGQLGVRLLSQEELLDFAELLLLCIPPPEVPRFFQALPAERTRHPVYLNTATDVDTPELVKSLGLERLKVIGLKPIGQFVAMRQRIPLMFVTSCADPDDLRLLERVLGPIGAIRTGDERNVGPLNHLATRLALRFAQTFAEEVRRYTEDPDWVTSALHSVVVGTLLDYPPAADNHYTARILKDLAAEAKAPVRSRRYR